MEIEKRLTSNYKDKPIVSKLLSVIEQESNSLKRQAEWLGDQFIVDRSSEGLRDWERMVGIIPDLNQPIQQRRRAVQERLAGFGILTEDKLDRLINSIDEKIWYEIDHEDFLISFTFPQDSLIDRNIYWSAGDFRVGYTPVQTENYPTVELGNFSQMARMLIAAHIAINYNINYDHELIEIGDSLIVETRSYQKAGNFKFGQPFAIDKEKVVIQ